MYLNCKYQTIVSQNKILSTFQSHRKYKRVLFNEEELNIFFLYIMKYIRANCVTQCVWDHL